MAYKALYRTYRPQRFDEVIGQEVIVKTLQNALANGKITHAYLFSGPRGTGKTTVARLLAKAINCSKGMNPEPCNECESCKEIMEGNNPDVIEIDAASNNGVDEIREIREKVKFLPGEGKYKVYIIDEVHMLTTSAFNALLKTLEEPPKHVIFILATTEPQKVLPTILSRCQRYDFKGLSVDEISRHVRNVCQKEDVRITDEALVALAESAEGGMRDALSYLDQAIALSDEEVTVDDINNVTGNLGYDKLIEIAECFENKNISLAMKCTNELLNMGKEVSKVLSGLLQFYRDMLLYKNVDTTEFKKYIFEKEKFRDLAKTVDDKKIFYYVDVLSEAQNRLRSATTPQIFLEVAMIKMVNVTSDDLNLISQVRELEEKINNIDLSGIASSHEVVTGTVDNEKVAQLEEKINRIISELGKLELPTLVTRVGMLEAKTSEKDEEEAIKEIQKEIDKLKEDVYLVKANYTSLANYQDNIDEDSDKVSVDPEIFSRIEKIEKDIERINQSETNYDEINDIIDDRLKNARREVSMDYDKINQMIDERVRNIEFAGGDVDAANKYNDEISQRLEAIEDKLYRVMSGALAREQIPTKPSKRKGPNERQMVLFGNDMIALDNIEKKAVKERVDFSGFSKQEKKEELPKEANLFTNLEEKEEEQEETPIVFEKKVIESSEEINKVKEEAPQDANVFGASKYESVGPAEQSLKRSGEVLSLGEEKPESKVDVFGISKYNVDSIGEKKLNESVNKLSDETKEKPDRIDPIIYKDAPKMTEGEELDEFERFDVGVIVRILNATRTTEARNDKVRIVNLWKNLVDRTHGDRKGVAQVLQDGEVVAVGDHELIIVYDSPSVCNQVMKRKFRKDSLKILFDLLGTTYNYLALPVNLWQTKREEYINQYRMGNTNIKLKPINESILNVLINANEKTPEEEMVSNARGLFGDDIIEYKG